LMSLNIKTTYENILNLAFKIGMSF
jgi:hypothetical protein